MSALGAGLTPDSTAYVSVARNLPDGRWFALWNGDVFRDHTPLFPMALAVPGLFGVDAVAGRCIAVRNLPRYGIARIATGQWTRSERRVWEAEFAPAGDERAGAPRPAATATGTPARGG